MTATTWEQVAKAKCAQRDAAIPPEWLLSAKVKDNLPLNIMDVPRTCGILTPKDITITETPAVELVAQMVTRELTSVEVTTAFCKRAAIAQQLTNCLTEIFFDQGIEDAAAIDAAYAKTGIPAGALHGLPVSLKDNINLPGLDSTVGFINYANAPADNMAVLAQALKDAGAVFFCKTNVPTGMLMGESYNNVWGYTSNPYNTEYGSGGSSGGESSLLALRGAPLGVGTDIGGSVRLPAAVTGIYGLKPGGGRISSLGLKSGLPGQEAVKSVAGPMSADLSSVELCARVFAEAKPWEKDPMVYNLPWKQEPLPEKLCFGMILDDGTVKATPAVDRVLRETKSALEAAGHKVLVWTPPDVKTGYMLIDKLLSADGGVSMANVIEGAIPEPWVEGLATFKNVYIARKGKEPTVQEMWSLQAQRQQWTRKLLESWIASRESTGTGRPFDGVIAPVISVPAAPRYKFSFDSMYTGLWNVSDQCGMVFPAGVASKNDVIPAGSNGYSANDELVWSSYDPERLDGIPIGLQIIVPRHEEELSLKLAAVAVAAIDQYRT